MISTSPSVTRYRWRVCHWRVLALFVVAHAGAACASAQAVTAQTVTAFTRVSVIDARDSVPRRDQTVIVRGNRIVASGASASTQVPSGARIVNGQGKFLIPGLWDMHVHTVTVGNESGALLSLYVANGVTGVRDMAGDWPTLKRWRADIAGARLVGPRIVASGPYLEGGDVPIPHILTRTPEEGRAGVDSLIKLGVDFVKVHGQLTPSVYFAIARRARERGIPFAGHVSRAIGAAAASDSGQRSIEHLLGVPAPCTPAESLSLAPRFTVQGAIGRCSSEDLAQLYARLVRNETWVTPTFVAAVEIANWPTKPVPGDSLAHYLPQALRTFVAQLFPMPDSIPVGAEAVGRAMLAKRMAQVAQMRRAGVRVMTGTDAPLRNSPPGFGLHEEMQLLVRGGMSTFDALRAATSEPALFLGLDSLGTVETGKVADLVLLDANPLTDIRNTRRISGVMANGRYYDAPRRNTLLRAGTTSK